MTSSLGFRIFLFGYKQRGCSGLWGNREIFFPKLIPIHLPVVYIREVSNQLDVPTFLTPVPNHLLCFHFVVHKRSRHLNGEVGEKMVVYVVYYESIKRDLDRRLIYECRCDERLKNKTEGSTRLVYTGLRGELEHLKISLFWNDKVVYHKR